MKDTPPEQAMDLSQLEKPVLELEAQIRAMEMDPSQTKEREKLEKKRDKLKADLFTNLTDWQRAQLARHPKRPYTLDYLERLCERFDELHGDRRFGDDAAIVAGMGWIDGNPLMIIGQQKGRDTKQKILRNFGMSKPEGYRKALRLMKLAEKFQRPILCLIDTPGAYPGVDAEERGQAEAIARNLREMAGLSVPIVVAIVGEGGSGGALGLAVGDRVLMLEYAIYSVISPEGCASILWRDPRKAPEAAAAMRITALDLQRLKLIDGIVPEPVGGAHRNHQEAAATLKGAVVEAFRGLREMPVAALLEQRYQKFRAMGVFENG